MRSGFALSCLRAFLRGGTPSGDFAQSNARGHAFARASRAVGCRVPQEFVLIVTASDPKALRLLCIDPNTLVGDALHKILTSAGYQVRRAENLGAALQLAGQDAEQIDVVISDHDVPPGSALDVLAQLKRTGYRGRVIVYSGQLTAAERAQYSEGTLDALVEKRDDAARLLSIMKALHGEKP